MKYIALLYADEKTEPVPGTDEFTQLIEDYQKAGETFNKDGVFVAGEPLESVETATTVRVRDGKTTMTDGPFAETKEQLGGFYIFECENIDEAVKYAAMIPSAWTGSVEVRPIMVLDIE